MTTIIDRLKTYKNSINLDERFTYNFENNSTFFSDDEKKEFNNDINFFRKNLRLKELIKIKANGQYNLTDLNFWIINKWGGIETFKRTENNLQKINSFSNQLQNNQLTKKNFDTISSLSKLSSFVNPDDYVIYDSRVIYAINWLILTTKNELKFFPMPTSRNKKLVDFDINTIIHLKYFDRYNNSDDLFYSYQEAYFKFCDLIKSLSKIVFDDQTIKPYYLEMLLFVIADNEIFNELTQWTTIEINKTYR